MDQSTGKNDEDHVPSTSLPNKGWTPRRRGACGTCKWKKVRCDGATPCENCKRHNVKCQYQPSKKRQSITKSVGSITPEEPLETSLYRSDNRRSTVDVRAESPNGGQLPQDPTISPIGEVSLVSNESSNNLRGMILVADDRNIMPEFLENFVSDHAWAPCMDWTNSDNSTAASADISNIHGSDMLSWGASTKSTNTEFDLSMPFLVENPQTITSPGISSLLGDLDLPLSPSGLNRDQDGPRSWGELTSISTMNFHEKTSKGGFLEHVPRIDFSLTGMFSPQDRGLESTSRTKQDEIERIFKRLSSIQTQTSVGLTSEQYDNSWYWSDTALMEKCKLACFQEPLGISTFLTRSCFDDYVQEANSLSGEGSAVIPLVDSVMAFGYRTLLAASQQSKSSEMRRKAIIYSSIALRSRDKVLRSPETLHKMQTILAMLIISEHIDAHAYAELLAGAVSCARTLGLMNRDSAMTKEKQYLARRSMWFLYSIEVPHSLRYGIPAVLTHDWIDYAPPEADIETDWLQIQCKYANVVSSAAEMLYSQKALRQKLEEREQNLDLAHKLLEGWRSCLPLYLQEIHRHDLGGITLDDQKMRHLALSMVQKYHEAIFIIFFPWTGSQSRMLVSEDYRRKSMQLCVHSAQAVLAVAAEITSLDTFNSDLILIALSICITFLDMVSSSGSKKSLPYLSMGCGIFGRLSLDNELPLEDVLELARVARQSRIDTAV